MIRALLVGAARVTFGLAVVALVVGAGLLYATWRLLRSAFADTPGRPVRDASFALLLAAEGLRRALAARADAAPPGPERPPEPQPLEPELEHDPREPLIPY